MFVYIKANPMQFLHIEYNIHNSNRTFEPTPITLCYFTKYNDKKHKAKLS